MDPSVSYRINGPARTPRQAPMPPRTGCACCSCDPGEMDEFCRQHGDGITYRNCEAHHETGLLHHGHHPDVITLMSVQQRRRGVPDVWASTE